MTEKHKCYRVHCQTATAVSTQEHFLSFVQQENFTLFRTLDWIKVRGGEASGQQLVGKVCKKPLKRNQMQKELSKRTTPLQTLPKCLAETRLLSGPPLQATARGIDSSTTRL